MGRIFHDKVALMDTVLWAASLIGIICVGFVVLS
jgi:hypothetical protein